MAATPSTLPCLLEPCSARGLQVTCEARGSPNWLLTSRVLSRCSCPRSSISRRSCCRSRSAPWRICPKQQNTVISNKETNFYFDCLIDIFDCFEYLLFRVNTSWRSCPKQYRNVMILSFET